MPLYFVSPREQTGWSISVAAFTAALHERWPAAKLAQIKSPASNHAVEFEVPLVRSTVTGALARDGQVLIVNHGHLRDYLEMAFWFRSLIPPVVPVIAYDDAGNCCDLATTTTEAALLYALQYAGD